LDPDLRNADLRELEELRQAAHGILASAQHGFRLASVSMPTSCGSSWLARDSRGSPCLTSFAG
jgi:hypothetical protein